ncbi:hypothetical protein OG21DRAFT_1488513 [Imleria badia]|nr:hypothetical protein OG21DRAFT_1488513 [Imleria badia]
MQASSINLAVTFVTASPFLSDPSSLASAHSALHNLQYTKPAGELSDVLVYTVPRANAGSQSLDETVQALKSVESVLRVDLKSPYFLPTKQEVIGAQFAHSNSCHTNVVTVQNVRLNLKADERSIVSFAHCRPMERSRKILRKIASASHQVIAAANEYADRRDSFNVERVHFQLEEEMQKISVACGCLASNLPMSLLPHVPAFDVRLKDWLAGDEPRRCYETLDQMEKLLQEDTTSRTSTGLTVRTMTATQDKIEEAVNLLDSRKGCFHFLFATDIWNNERGVRQQKEASQCRDDNIRTNLDTTLPEVARHDVGHANTERRHDTQVDEEKKENAKKLEEILKWLDGLNCAEKQDATLSLRQPDTCKWLFDTTQYKKWRDDDSSFLWLRGKPGAGKSVLASFVVNSLEESLGDGEFLAFFYCDFRNQRCTCAAEVMRSILSQLLRQLRGSGVDPGRWFDELMKATERGGGTRKNAKQLAGFVSHVAGLAVRRPLVIVDALDECKDVPELLQALMVIKGRVRLFVTSRPLHAIMSNLSGLPFVSMDDTAEELSADIELHVTRELDARQRLRDLDTEVKTEIRSVLCRKADGMFRWVQCSIDTLNRCVTRKDVRNALNDFPEGLEETYERIIVSIDTNAREAQVAQRALVWLVAALRPLHLEELMEGLSINLSTRTLDADFQPMHNGALLDACGCLVTYIEKNGVIILSHFSIREYLMGKFTRFKLPCYHVNWELAHLHLARLCMCYISICLNHPQTSGRSSDTLPHVPGVSPDRGDYLCTMSQRLRDYVLDHAPDHFSHLGPQIGSILHDIKVLELDTQSHSRMWDNMCLSSNQVTHCTSPGWPTSKHDFRLYILVAFGPNSVLRKFIRRMGLKSKEGTNPLVYAAYFNKPEHACTLLSQGARLNLRGWDSDGFCPVLPIEVAFRNHHYETVTLFITEGSHVPLHIFGMLYHRNHDAKIPSSVVRILLQTDDFAEAARSPLTDVFLRPSALSDCILKNDINEQDLVLIIRRFIQVGYDPHRATSRDTLIRIVAQLGLVAVVQYLLSLGVSCPSDLLVTSNLEHMRNAVYMIPHPVENGAPRPSWLRSPKSRLLGR